ncbi:NAD/FAD-dependent oxidoreductase [Actinoplanes sp. ATCC 53533]|uniref:NAD(P)/FAD-dependent oxidoreductase n=1 Tax=Actinoplanes sp. ATCC 53533 TaxID=1288362 RepID=UPI000F7837CA|nr:FAD-dependent oxidoreductase [Actinoplanes sp. ATCC 53533]RSM65435.1 NAD/FAD-dependent oxidoreductase [Actinoplanes sp. ATCC 53533]
MRVVVVGAGVAGLSCARELAAGGVAVRVHERGRVVGGRLASKRFDGRYADLGAAYFVADHPDFAALAGRWRARGLARPWTDTLAVYPGGTTTGPVRWAAPGGLRSLATDLAGGLNVRLGSELTAIPADADAVVLAMPGPQALRLRPPAAVADVARAQVWEPVLAAVCTYGKRSWPEIHGAFVNDHPVLATIFDDGDRRGDAAPVLVAHSTAAFARPRLADPSAAAGELAAAVNEVLSLTGRPEVHVHRWTYASPAPGTSSFATDGRVWLAGDAFGKPRVQTAWLSGRAVARAILGGQSSER